MRPRTIELSCGLALQRDHAQTWWCTNSTEFVGSLRDLIGTLAHEPAVVAHYGHTPGLECTYDIIAEIRAQHGYHFLWSVFAPDNHAIVITDELDDYCCESRAWFTGGDQEPRVIHHASGQVRPYSGGPHHAQALAALECMGRRWNHRLGQAEDPNFTELHSLPPWSLHREGDLWVFRAGDDRKSAVANTRVLRPRGLECEETAWLVGTILSLANVVDLPGLPARITT